MLCGNGDQSNHAIVAATLALHARVSRSMISSKCAEVETCHSRFIGNLLLVTTMVQCTFRTHLRSSLALPVWLSMLWLLVLEAMVECLCLLFCTPWPSRSWIVHCMVSWYFFFSVQVKSLKMTILAATLSKYLRSTWNTKKTFCCSLQHLWNFVDPIIQPLLEPVIGPWCCAD